MLHNRALAVCTLALGAACATSGNSQLPLPRSVRAICTMGIYGGGSYTELLPSGEVRVVPIGPNRSSADTLVGRDSARVHALLVRVARLPWQEMRTPPNLYDTQCGLSAIWDDTTRSFGWFMPSPPPELAIVGRLHSEIRSLGTRTAVRATRALAAANHLPPRSARAICIVNIHGGRQQTEIRANGEIYIGPSGADPGIEKQSLDNLVRLRLHQLNVELPTEMGAAAARGDTARQRELQMSNRVWLEDLIRAQERLAELSKNDLSKHQPRDSLIGRDSMRVAPLIERFARLPWRALSGSGDNVDSYGSCWLEATWDTTVRSASWQLADIPQRLSEAARLHDEIRALTFGFSERMASDSLGTRLESGCGGGFTGGGGGLIVTQDGRLLSWRRERAGLERTVTLLRRDPTLATELFQAAERGGITRVKFSEPSNMSCSLSLIRGITRHTVTWRYGSSPSKIRALVELSNRMDTP